MPPRKPRSTVYDEADLARRIALERQLRSWSQVELAERMTAIGSPMWSSTIQKIESDPPRRITVSEFLAFARVLELSLEELLVPPEAVAAREARRLWDIAVAAGKELERYELALHDAREAFDRAHAKLEAFTLGAPLDEDELPREKAAATRRGASRG